MKTIRNILLCSLMLALPGLARADSNWVLTVSTLTYHVTHPLHHAEGVSHAARGKGICQAGVCNWRPCPSRALRPAIPTAICT